MNTISKKIKKDHILKIGFAICIGLMCMLATSCNKTNSTSHVEVQMTDAPGDYDAVMVDIQGVEITGSDGNIALLNTSAGIYNLLTYADGLTTLIANGDIKPGTISQIRLILGTNNTVLVNGVSYPLSTPSAQQSGLKLQVHQTFVAGVSYTILLDFDANKSIISQGNGNYQLKPVIRTIEEATSGTVKGHISPTGLTALISASYNGITYTSTAATNGKFQIAGLPAGIYDITVTPALPRAPVLVTNVIITNGHSTDIGEVSL